MLRRDFLKTISAFAAAASAGGTAVAGFTPPTRAANPGPAVWGPPSPAEPVISPAGIVNLTLVRGDDLLLHYDGFDRIALPREIGWWIGGLLGTLEAASNDASFRLHATSQQTARLRPGVVPWGIAKLGRLPGGPAPQTLITGTATILPDDLWRAEEEVLKIAPQMHPLGVIERNDRFEVMFRGRLRADETSRYDGKVESLISHCRPVEAQIINRGQGARIDFACRGLL